MNDTVVASISMPAVRQPSRINFLQVTSDGKELHQAASFMRDTITGETG